LLLLKYFPTPCKASQANVYCGIIHQYPYYFLPKASGVYLAPFFSSMSSQNTEY
jgi:hypothetical protein